VIDWAAGQGRLMAGGKSLEWATTGPAPGEAPALVLLHEGLGCVALWRDFPQRLHEATGLSVFAFSRAGYGQSDPVALPRSLDYMTREATGVLGEVLDQLGAVSFILLGHSDGATIAAEYAGRVEDHRVRGLVLIAPHFFGEPGGLASIAAIAASYPGDLRPRLAKYHRAPDVAFLGWSGAWLDPANRGWDVSEVIDYFRVPVLAIQGLDDEYGTPAQVEEIERRSYAPVEMLLLEGCGHAPQFERPDEVLAAVAAFTGRLLRIEAA